eukprot:Plantae.Rhodophyta-Rhodochaete_pulchella.ctg5706.p1 GENE.Plantae.Rhodophyta-Rhodochaete_pulchella.ctg5706~~Plantae.Rhodophyta-Rhodochaete_pulchella.ctg5706.p1  ORF type:complete len:445 (-),score=37.36 Plantae.Rhodophyta-Rhodochaete_pulchella.ctg5706:315-1649(-)
MTRPRHDDMLIRLPPNPSLGKDQEDADVACSNYPTVLSDHGQGPQPLELPSEHSDTNAMTSSASAPPVVLRYALLCLVFRVTFAQDISALLATYNLDAEFAVPTLSASCPSEVSIDTTAGEATVLTLQSAQLEVAGAACSGGNVPLQRVTSFTYKAGFNGFPEFRIRIVKGLWGSLPADEGNITCGDRTFGANTTFIYVEDGKFTWRQETEQNDTVIPIRRNTLMTVTTSGSVAGEAIEVQVCGLTAEAEGCFPASATVQTETGMVKRMDELAVGDRVISSPAGGSSEIYIFGHRQRYATHRFVEIRSTKGESVRLSPKHYIYVVQSGALVRKTADSVAVGDLLVPVGRRDPAQVASVTTVSDVGLFAPHTVHGDIVVDGFLASTYTAHFNPVLAHAALAPIRWVYLLSGGRFNIVGSRMDNGLPSSLLPRKALSYISRESTTP